MIEIVFAAVERATNSSVTAAEDSRLTDEKFVEAVLQPIELDKSDLDKGSRHRDEPIWIDMGLTLMSIYESVPSICMQTFRCRKSDRFEDKVCTGFMTAVM